MTTGSTPSSGTDRPDPDTRDEAGERRPSSAPVTPPAPAGPPDASTPSGLTASTSASRGDARDAVDAGRRAFFFEFGKQAVSAVGQVAGMADMASRSASAMANELLGIADEGSAGTPAAFTRSGAASEPVVSAAPPAAEHVFRSAYRLTADGLVLLDQRRIPEALDEVVARRGSDVAYYLRLGVARGGPLMAQLAAYGLALTAAERADQPAEQRDVELRRTERALVEARPSARLLPWATARVRALLGEIAPATPGAEVAMALRAEAEAMASQMSSALARMAVNLAEALPRPEDRPLVVLIHGSQGALAGGLVGSGIAALTQVRDAGRELRIFVTEGRPFMDGARLASWELRQAGLDHRIVPDSAVAWLLEHERPDAVLIAAEWVAANGDSGALVGARAIAQLVHVQPTASRPHLLVHGLTAARDPETPDGSAIPEELRPARELSAYLKDVPVRTSDALVPAADVVPADGIDAFVTELGVERRDT